MEGDAPLRLQFDRFDLDEANARLAREGVAVPVPPKAFGVLCTLLRRPGQLVSKNQLLDAVWGHRFVSESVLKTTISELRGALADDARAPRYVETAARRGYRFIGPLLAAATLPEIAGSPSLAPLVGRRAELERLHSLWQAADAGQRQVCWIAGEAGIGKTTVIDALLARIGPVSRAQGQCIEQFGAAEPYLPVLDALGSLCRSDPDLVQLLRTTAPTWLLQMPWLTTPDEHAQLRTLLAAVSQDRMLREFAELVERYTAARTLVLVTEDLHWCDDATVRLLEHVARRRTPARLLWIGSFRLAELVATNHPLSGVRHELRARHLAHELLLEPFSETELAHYLERHRPAAGAAEALVQRIHRQTDGLPLFVANIVEHLHAAPVAGGDAAVPGSLAGVIERQIDRLPGELAQLLEAAAVCGVQFSVGLLAEVLSRTHEDIAAHCDTLVRGQYWIAPVTLAALPDGSLDMQHVFRHALYREVFYQRAGALQRAHLHRRVAQALAARRSAGLTVSAAELATHCERGLDIAGALHAYAAAAENALRCFAPVEAVQLTAHASELLQQLPAGMARLEIELTLTQLSGSAHAQSSGVASPQGLAAFRRAAEIAEQLPDSPRTAWVLVGMAWMSATRGEFGPALRFARRLHELAGREHEPVLRATACAVNAIPLMQQGDLAHAGDLIEEGVLATAGLEPGRLQMVVVMDPVVVNRGVGACLAAHRGELQRAQAWLQIALQQAQDIVQPISRGFSLRCAGMVLLRLDDPQALHARGSQMAALVREHGLRQGSGPSECLLGYAEARLGEAAAGHARIAPACAELAASGTRFDLALFWRLAAEAAWLQGDAAASAAHLQRAFAVASEIGERLHVPDLLRWRAHLESAAGDAARARASLQEAVALAAAMGIAMAELEARTALARLGAATRRDLAALRKLRAAIDAPAGLAPLQRADEVLADVPRG